MSIIYIVDIAKDFIEKIRKRPIKTLINARIIRKVFSDKHIKKLEIPQFINDYNDYIRGINLINQFKVIYKTYKAINKN